MRLSSASLTYREDIDGLRAVAVLLVLVFHFALFMGAKAGFLGVDVFFVISGFLITSIIKGQLDSGSFSLLGFYTSRVRRLAPALLVVLVSCVVFGGIFLFPQDWVRLSTEALFSQIYLSNFYYWRNVNYSGFNVQNTYLLHTWSLAVEEQFYVCFPICLILIHRYVRHLFWLAIAVGFLLSFAFNLAFVGSKPEATFYLLPTRAWELILGALLPLAASHLPASKTIDETLGFVGGGLIVAAVLLYDSAMPFPGTFALLPTIGAACLLVSGREQDTIASRALSWSPLVYIGQISYSLYLVHWPVNIFASYLVPDYSLPVRASMFALCFVLAGVLYRTIENPVRRRVYLPANRPLMIAYGVGVAATAALFFGLHATRGMPQRFPAEAVRLAAYANDRTEPLEQCEFTKGALPGIAGGCEIGGRRDPALARLWGLPCVGSSCGLLTGGSS